MKDSDRPRFATVMAAVCETFGQEATTARIMGYWLGLQDLELADVERAAAQAVQKCDRMPVPAKLREFVEGREEDAEVLSWALVEKAMPLGAYRHVSFEDPAINAAIRSLGGWPTLFERCRDAESQKWYRIDFTKAYRAFRSRGCSGDVSRPLAGLSEVSVVDGKRTQPLITLVERGGGVKLLAAPERKPRTSLIEQFAGEAK